MPILVQNFTTTSTTFVAWWINSWQCSNASWIALATKTSFVLPQSLTQKNKKTNLIPMLKCKQCKKNYVYNYEIYHPWIILESWYVDIESISLAWLRLLDFNVQCEAPHATFKGFT